MQEDRNSGNSGNSGIDDIMKFASSILGNGSSFMNSPEFSKTVELLTKGLMDNFANDQMTSRSSHKKRTVNTENRTKDLILELPITLEEFYHGKTKKITVKRKRAHKQSDGSYKIVEERHKILVPITRGLYHNYEIVFPNEADDLPGLEQGDVIIILKQIDHPVYTRINNDLLVKFDISISEMFYFNTNLVLLDGSILNISNSSKDFISENGSLRKLSSKGMPLPSNNDVSGDLFIRFNIISDYAVVPLKDDLVKLFPPINNLNSHEEASECIQMESLNDDDYYKFDVFEEENEYDDDMFPDDFNENDCNLEDVNDNEVEELDNEEDDDDEEEDEEEDNDDDEEEDDDDDEEEDDDDEEEEDDDDEED